MKKAQKTILYVDDEEINLFIMKTIFAGKVNVKTASGAKEGLKMIRNFPLISLVVSDFNMPLMNGIDFIREIKKIRFSIPCYILTANSLNDDLKKALDEKLILKVIQKPFQEKDIGEELILN